MVHTDGSMTPEEIGNRLFELNKSWVKTKPLSDSSAFVEGIALWSRWETQLLKQVYNDCPHSRLVHFSTVVYSSPFDNRETN